MANTIRIKRRLSGGTDAPSILANGELAFNEVTRTLYYGLGVGGTEGTATAIIAIAGTGAYVALTGDQTIQGNKTFTNAVAVGNAIAANHAVTKQQLDDAVANQGNMLASVYDPRTIAADVFNVDNHTDGILYKVFTAVEQAKLASIAPNATANATDTYLLSRANHTGAQAISTITGLQTALNAKVNTADRGVANGIATLGVDGKVPLIQLPDSVLGGMAFVDFWNAATNVPTIPPAALANKGNYYIVQVAGNTNINGITDWEVGDWVVSNGSVWSKIDNTDAVISVNGQKGAVVIDVDDLASAGSMAKQNSNAVAITGGTIDNIVFDGGVF